MYAGVPTTLPETEMEESTARSFASPKSITYTCDRSPVPGGTFERKPSVRTAVKISAPEPKGEAE